VIHYEASHAVLLTGINMREAMQGECADKSVAAGRWEPVGGAAVLGIKVEDAVWQRPIERKEAPKFGACEVGYEQALRSAVERGAAQGQELVNAISSNVSKGLSGQIGSESCPSARKIL
jgi:hypothetical protein